MARGMAESHSYAWRMHAGPISFDFMCFLHTLCQIIASDREKLALVRKEIDIHSALSSHPSILPLLDYDIVTAASKTRPPTALSGLSTPPPSAGQSTSQRLTIADMDSEEASGSESTAYLLLPADPDGTLAEEVEGLSRRGAPRLSVEQVLGIFIQVRNSSS